MTRILTPLELQVMNLLWEKGKVFVKDLLDAWPLDDEGKKPAYNTVSTIVRILETEDKGFIGHKAYGRTHEYYPLITKAEYQKSFLKNALDKVFAGSITSLVSTLVDDEKVNQDDLDELKKLL